MLSKNSLPTAHKAVWYFFIIALLSPMLLTAQLPPSICSPLGGKRADIISVQSAYRAPGGAAPSFTIPTNATSAFVVVSNHNSVIASPPTDQNLSDEDFITTNASLNFLTSRSSGFLNYAQSTNPTSAETNLYSWINLPFGSFASTQIAQGQSAPTLLNNVRFSVSGNTLTITESNVNTAASYMVEFASAASNSLLENGFERVILTGAAQTSSTPIPANTDIIVVTKKGTVRVSNTASVGGTEEGFANGRIIMDLDAATTNGYMTVVNGANISFRSTYSIVNHPIGSSTRFLASGNVIGDFTGKSITSNSTNDVGIADPAIYVSGSNLVIDRSTAYRNNFDDVYVLEFYRRTGNAMSVEFIETQSQFIASGQGTTAGTNRVLNIPAGAEYVVLRQAGNANNSVNPHNENALASYAVIDLKTETATGYFYQQVGFTTITARRDDNYGFRNLPLDGTSSRNPTYSAGIYFPNGGTVYDLRFTLSANKSQLTVTNAFGLVAANYQVITVADFFGSRPDYAFPVDVASNFSYANNGQCGQTAVTVTLCNPGSGNSPGGIPTSFYIDNPTTNPAAKLVHISTFAQSLVQGTCVTFSFNIDLKSLGVNDPNIKMFAIINDNGSFVPGGVGNAVGTPFTLASLSTQGSQYTECDYTNNLVEFDVAGVMPCSEGTLLRDANALLVNNQIDGTPIGIISAQQLYVNVLDASNNVVFTSAVNNTTGKFTAQPNGVGSFSFQLTTNQGTVGQPAPATVLPAGWVYTGENINTSTGSDGTANGVLPVPGLTTSATVNTLLGIQQRPESVDYTGYGWTNPGGTDLQNVPTAAFRASDGEDGTYPSNISGRKITLYPATNGTLYYNGSMVSSATTITNFDNDLVGVDPTAEGNTTISFQYAAWDNADFADATPATVTMGFGGVILPATGLMAKVKWVRDHALIEWSTLSENNTSHFDMQRSINGLAFYSIGTKNAAGNTNQLSSYTYTDSTASAGTIYYRVKLFDKNGDITLSNIAVLSPNTARKASMHLWPNPASNQAYLYLPEQGEYQLQLLSPLGAVLQQKVVAAATGGSTITIERNGVPAGTYFLKMIHSQTKEVSVLKINFN